MLALLLTLKEGPGEEEDEFDWPEDPKPPEKPDY